MTRWATLVACLLLACVFWSSKAEAVDAPGVYSFRSYGPDQGLRNQAVTSLAQDRAGFLYVGTEDGLFRYDGERFQRLGVADGLPSDGVSVLHATRQGRLWVALDKGLIAWDGLAPDPRARRLLLPDQEVRGIASSDAGRLLVSTSGGIFEGDARELKRVPGVPPQAGAGWLSADGTEALLAVAGRLYRRDANGRWKSRALPPTVAGETVQALVEDARGRIWLRGWQLLVRLESFAAPDPDLSVVLPGAPVHKGELHLDAAGRVWAPTDRGIAFFDRDKQGLIDAARGLPNEWATTVLMDREGSLWVGSEGVHRLQGRMAWTSFNRKQGLPADTVWAVLRDRTGTLWAATQRGIAHATATGWVATPIAGERSFYAFAESATGDLWVGGNGDDAKMNTLLRRPQGTNTFVAVPLGSAPNSTVNSLAFGSDGALYVATMGHGLHRMTPDGAGFKSAPVLLPGGTEVEQINQVVRDAQGRLWAAGTRGLASYDGHRWTRMGVADGLLEAHVETVTPAGSDGIWVSYWNVNGMTLVRNRATGPAVAKHVTRPGSLVEDAIYSIGLDSHDAVWLGTAMGVKRWRGGRVERFGRADGLPSEDAVANAFWADANGDVWFGMANGLARFDARNDAGLPAPPVALITSVQDGRGQQLASVTHAVAWSDRALTFRFAALSFLDETRIQRQVRLLGFEDAWRNTEVSEARYTGLLPGTYRFQVRARYGTGDFGPVATRAVEVLPPWWLTWWFLVLAGFGVVLLAVLAVRWRLGHLRRRNLQLEELVGARTRELQLAKAAVEEASMIDPLTALKNRRYLSAFLPEELARCIRQQRERHDLDQAERASLAIAGRNIDLCLLLVDLDHFKAVNDSHGHAGGDAVLRQVGQVMRAACRESDVVVRWGGEEFLILARNADRAQAKGLAATVCDAIRSHPFDLGSGVVLRMTCSVGFTAFPLVPGQPDRFGWEVAVDLADQCLYAAKKSGRDGWVGCLVQDTVQSYAEGALPGVPGMRSRGQCQVQTSFHDSDALQWKE